MRRNIADIAKPFVKWVGGKSQLIGQIEALMPDGFDALRAVRYVEPFVGGGAMLFHFLRHYANITSAVINDINADLIGAYLCVRDHPGELIASLKAIEAQYYSLPTGESRKAFYYQMRERFNAKRGDTIENATLLIFLNRTCFNGLYRVNKAGRFNVPFGRYAHPRICDSATILADSRLLQDVEIMRGDFGDTIARIKGPTLFYIDPPYRPLSLTSSFHDYTAMDFDDEEQRRLKLFCDTISGKGAMFMLSNSDCLAKDGNDTFFDDLYQDYHISRVWATRSVNADPAKRGKLTEILVDNFDMIKYDGTHDDAIQRVHIATAGD